MISTPVDMNRLVRRLVSYNVGNKVITIVVFHPVRLLASLANFLLLDTGLPDSHFRSNSILSNFSRATLTITSSHEISKTRSSSLHCNYLFNNPCRLRLAMQVPRDRRTTKEISPLDLLTAVPDSGMAVKATDKVGKIVITTVRSIARLKVPTSPMKRKRRPCRLKSNMKIIMTSP